MAERMFLLRGVNNARGVDMREDCDRIAQTVLEGCGKIVRVDFSLVDNQEQRCPQRSEVQRNDQKMRGCLILLSNLPVTSCAGTSRCYRGI